MARRDGEYMARMRAAVAPRMEYDPYTANTISATEFRLHAGVYLHRVVAGERIEITRNGRVVAELVKKEDSRPLPQRRVRGVKKGSGEDA